MCYNLRPGERRATSLCRSSGRTGHHIRRSGSTVHYHDRNSALGTRPWAVCRTLVTREAVQAGYGWRVYTMMLGATRTGRTDRMEKRWAGFGLKGARCGQIGPYRANGWRPVPGDFRGLLDFLLVGAILTLVESTNASPTSVSLESSRPTPSSLTLSSLLPRHNHHRRSAIALALAHPPASCGLARVSEPGQSATPCSVSHRPFHVLRGRCQHQHQLSPIRHPSPTGSHPVWYVPLHPSSCPLSAE